MHMNDFIIDNDARQDSPHRELLDLIPLGQKNAINIYQLAAKMDEDYINLLRKIAHAQLDGNVIAVIGEEVFIPESYSELYSYFSYAKAKIVFDLEALNNIHKKLTGERVVLVYEGEDYEETLLS